MSMHSNNEVRRQFPLDEVGTRLEHYLELRDIFDWGVQHLESKAGKSMDENSKLSKLKAAVEVINKRLDVLTNYENEDTKTSAFGSMLRQLNLERLDGSGEWVPKKLMGEVIDATERRTEENTDDQADGASGFPEGWATH